MPSDLKTFLVEVKTQFDTCNDRTTSWTKFGTYETKDKAEAIKRARRDNFTNMWYDNKTFGLVWFRATEVVENAPNVSAGPAKCLATSSGNSFWQIGSQVYRLALPYGHEHIVLDGFGIPMGVRWECTLDHFNHYRDSAYGYAKSV